MTIGRAALENRSHGRYEWAEFGWGVFIMYITDVVGGVKRGLFKVLVFADDTTRVLQSVVALFIE